MASTHVHISEECDLRFPLPELTDDAFFAFCNENKEYRIERTAEGKIEIMPGTGGETGNANAALTSQVYMWAVGDRRGLAFDSSTMFRLPSSAMRMPDAAWVSREKWGSLTREQRKQYVPLCPEFVVELLSPTDRLTQAKAKMAEWIENGCELAWLIDPATATVYMYSPRDCEVLQGVEFIAGSGPVDGLRVDLRPIWNAGE